ncbi:CAP-Gly domain protein [Shinella oryzae]|uniref:CAP-Gly domain protein n=1 Tax=Shinella oryzae TaxID=2871820 RepID=UPI001FF4DCD6|nr:CAP-Gly domain protein [Shinella oryzae]UPA24087.1 CAP-Gly domain protein [Shinella oryzae]
MPTFQVGQKVVCINDRFKNVSIDQGIRKGQVYTVRWAGHYRHYVDGDFYGIKLMELYRGKDDGPEGYGAVDMPFRASRFRPLVSDRIRNMLGIKAPQPKTVIAKPSIVPAIRPKPRVVTPEREKEDV